MAATDTHTGGEAHEQRRAGVQEHKSTGGRQPESGNERRPDERARRARASKERCWAEEQRALSSDALLTNVANASEMA